VRIILNRLVITGRNFTLLSLLSVRLPGGRLQMWQAIWA